MTTNMKWDIQWSPTQSDVFLTYGADRTDLNLYTVEAVAEDSDAKSQGQHISKERAVKLQASKLDLYIQTKSDLSLIKCFACYPKPIPENLLALGLSNGKVVLSAFNTDPSLDQSGFVGAEFLPKHSKMCSSLAWNPADNRLIAVGYDRYRTDHCLAIFDITAKNVTEVASTHQRYYSLGHGVSAPGSRPMAEMVQGEMLNSVAWLPHSPHCLFAGVSNKTIRIYDIRDLASYKKATTTKAVFGITIDPLGENRLASFFEGVVTIWDSRNFDKPVLTITEARSVVKLAWSPHRYGVLGALCKDSSVVKLYNVQHVSGEVEYTERLIHPCRSHQVSTFAWHPSVENQMLTVTPTGTLKEVIIHDPISLTLSSLSTCVLASGRKLLHCTPDVGKQVDDISTRMKERAMSGYGLCSDPLSKNCEYVGPGDQHLKKLWQWLDNILFHLHVTVELGLQINIYIPALLFAALVSPVVGFEKIKSLRDKEKMMKKTKPGFKYYGVKALITGEASGGEGSKSDIDTVEWKGINEVTESRVFRSSERYFALQLCGWGWEISQDENEFNEFIQRLEGEGDFERAAAIAVFRVKIRQAIEVLHKGAQVQKTDGNVSLNAIAMALSGFTKEKNALWCEMCSSLCKNLTNPYLRAMFGFLTTCDNSYDAVLREPGLSVEDRIAFACLFLSDMQIYAYVEELMDQAITEGDLQGILLSGLTKDGVTLLQAYVDMTADVQTASLVAVQCLPSELCKDQRVTHWIESYRSLLDTWTLWHQRARFDVLYHQGTAKVPTPQQIFVNCNFCQTPISPCVLANTHSRHLAQFRGPSRQKVNKPATCFKCRKALPRCSLCLMNMGTMSGLKHVLPPISKDRTMSPPDPSSSDKQTDFSKWFTWCQSCRHGGHANHLTEWFRDHRECAVTGCVCHCMQMDSVGTVLSAESIPTSQAS
ncbi:GATOR2 complex protein MIOS-like [Amphiura filiformis]|uniref:GATOR2 complex protein MIOS-like n=1 Tax=Amphiura filiformis TaxID=82378 RepID=UPI003B223C8F